MFASGCCGGIYGGLSSGLFPCCGYIRRSNWSLGEYGGKVGRQKNNKSWRNLTPKKVNYWLWYVMSSNYFSTRRLEVRWCDACL